MEIITKTDIGKVREINQDYVLYFRKNENEGIVALCDGMGGHNAGEIASMLTSQDIIKQYKVHGEFHNDDEIKAWMIGAIQHANHLVLQESHLDPQLEGMGTTVVVALIHGDQLYVSHVGDSRAYYFDGTSLQQLTVDDTLVNVLVESGTISKDEAQFHPQKNILLQAVGVSDVLKVSFYSQKFEDGLVLLCTDGLYNSLFQSRIIDILNKQDSLENIGRYLIDEANQYGGRDNIGIALIMNKGVEGHE